VKAQCLEISGIPPSSAKPLRIGSTMFRARIEKNSDAWLSFTWLHEPAPLPKGTPPDRILR
jgi:hypothetical protein